MKTNQHNITAIITALGGRAAVQALLGVGPSAISNYHTRGVFPRRATGPLLAALQARGYQVDPDSLTILTAPQFADGTNDLHGGNNGTGFQKTVLLIVGGGIAAYKALEVARRLQDHNIRVIGIMTKGAQQFITPLSLAALTEEKTYTDLFSLTDEAEMGHIQLARMADLVLVVPATANLMARVAQGMADDLASTVMLATTAPIMMAPAMNPVMWGNAATQHNHDILAARGVQFIGPADGDTACGEFGSGRLSDPMTIVAATIEQLDISQDLEATQKPLAGKRAIVTSGPTYEPIDAVRFIANRSSGKQGHAIAAALANAGASVTLISGPVAIDDPAGVTMVRVETAAQMLDACMAGLPADIAIFAAAVSDWRVRHPQNEKIKKNKTSGSASPQLDLVENPDILAQISAHENRPQIVVGFAAETNDLLANATDKLRRKGCDWIIANHIATDGAPNVFGSDNNAAHFITPAHGESWPNMQKSALAKKLVGKLTEVLAND